MCGIFLVTDTHALLQPLFPRAMTCSWAQTLPPPPPPPQPPSFLPSSLHLFPFSPGELVFGFSYFPEVCLLFPSLPCLLHDTSVNICVEVEEEGEEEEEDWGGGVWGVCVKEAVVYSCQTSDVLQLLSGPCDAADAAEGLRCPAKSAIFCPYPARSVHQW